MGGLPVTTKTKLQRGDRKQTHHWKWVALALAALAVVAIAVCAAGWIALRSRVPSTGGSMEVTEITRGHILVRVGDKTATVFGEMMIPAPGKFGFLLYKKPVQWKQPFDAELIDDATREAIVQVACDHLSKMGVEVEFIESAPPPPTWLRRETTNK
jgi:hypothetical protein